MFYIYKETNTRVIVPWFSADRSCVLHVSSARPPWTGSALLFLSQHHSLLYTLTTDSNFCFSLLMFLIPIALGTRRPEWTWKKLPATLSKLNSHSLRAQVGLGTATEQPTRMFWLVRDTSVAPAPLAGQVSSLRWKAFAVFTPACLPGIEDKSIYPV